jgi:hypothetical protein
VRHEAEPFFQQRLLLLDDLFLVGPGAGRLRFEVGEGRGQAAAPTLMAAIVLTQLSCAGQKLGILSLNFLKLIRVNRFNLTQDGLGGLIEIFANHRRPAEQFAGNLRRIEGCLKTLQLFPERLFNRCLGFHGQTFLWHEDVEIHLPVSASPGPIPMPPCRRYCSIGKIVDSTTAGPNNKP